MPQTFHHIRSNRRDNIITAVVFGAILCAGLAASIYLHAPWWVYAGLGFFTLVIAIASYDQISRSGEWEVYLHPDEGGYIKSPSGYLEFAPTNIVGLFMCSGNNDGTGDNDGGAGGGYYLCFDTGYIYLNNSALPVFRLRKVLKRFYGIKLENKSIDIVLDAYPDEIAWTSRLNQDYVN